MAESNDIENEDDSLARQLATFAATIGTYAHLLDLSPPQITSQAADSNFFTHLLTCTRIMQQSTRQWVAWKDLARTGGVPSAKGAPLAPVFPPAVPSVALGIEARFHTLVRQIKAHPAYTIAIGTALAIEAPPQISPNLATLQPVLTTAINDNRVEILWNWSGHRDFLDRLHIEVDRNDGRGFQFLTSDADSSAIDSTSMPEVPVKWIYRAIYGARDALVGHWSKPAAITVGG